VVFADLFYEWQARAGARKQPWCVRLHDDGPFALAALWDVWSPRDGDAAPLTTFTLITTDANALMQDIHDRMPVIIAPDHLASWLDMQTPLDVVESMLAPYDAHAMKAWRVSTRVNSPAHDDAACAEPITPPQTELL
jgi:putative SOS response-associated peptidase YedK